MKREDLKNGSILETRSGEHCFVIDNDLHFIESGLQSDLFRFNDNLIEAEGFADDDIMKVCIDPMKSNEWDWERKETPILTDDEKAFLKMLNPRWKWIINGCGDITLFENEPTRTGGSRYYNPNGKFTTISFDTFNKEKVHFKLLGDKPYSIEELLEGSEEDEEDRTSKARP